MTDRYAAQPPIPRSGAEGIVWPAVPEASDAIILSLLHQLQQSEWWSPEELQRHQFAQAERLIAHAFDTVPFYRQRLKDVMRLPTGGLTEEAWQSIPIFTRQEAQANEDVLISRRVPKSHGNLESGRTGGSTARPLSFKTTGLATAIEQAQNLRRMIWHGRDFSAKAARIVALKQRGVALPPRGVTEASWAPVFPTGPSAMLSMQSTTDEQLDWLQREAPGYLLTLPSILKALLQLSERKGVRIDALRGVGTFSEPVDADLRELCHRAWGVDLVDVYSGFEIGSMATQCPDHVHYHVHSDSVLVEVLDEAGRPCGPGETGRVVITSLINFAMPMIRYAIGDIAEAGPPCPCGRGLPVLNQILGRTRNMLVYPDGRTIKPRVVEGFSDQPAVQQFQVIQQDLERVEVRVVAGRELTAAETGRMRDKFNEFVGHPFAIDVVYVDEIPRAPSGKFEEFWSEVAAGRSA